MLILWTQASSRLLKRTLLVAAMLFMAVIAFAQDVAPTLPIGANEQEKLVIAVFAVLLPFATNAIRSLMPTMPRMLVWSIPPFLGLATGWVASYFSSGVTGWKGLAGGLIAISMWELRTTFKAHGVNG